MVVRDKKTLVAYYWLDCPYLHHQLNFDPFHYYIIRQFLGYAQQSIDDAVFGQLGIFVANCTAVDFFYIAQCRVTVKQYLLPVLLLFEWLDGRIDFILHDEADNVLFGHECGV
ncbi:MAG: hypothetical protein R2788_24255 [Saprospiraceae bacterium]